MFSSHGRRGGTQRPDAGGPTTTPPAGDAGGLLADLFRGLGEAGVSYCLLRGADRLVRPTGDVDLLVSPGDVEAFHDVAGRVGFALERRWAQDTQHHLLGLDGSHPIALHAVTQIGFGPPAYPWILRDAGAGILQRRALDDRPALASPVDEFWLSLHHCLLDKGQVALHHRSRLHHLLGEVGSSRSGTDLSEADLAAHLGVGLRRDLLQAASDGRWADVEGLRRQVRRRLRRGQHLPARSRAAIRHVGLTGRKVVERHTRRGVSVALMGPDGAGKSSLADNLAQALPLPTTRAYLGLYPTATRTTGPAGLPGLSLLARVGRLWRAWLATRHQQSRRRVVILDRHPADARLSQPAGGRADTVRRWLLGRCLPLPDVVLILDAPGEVLYQRSGEHSPAQLERQREAYRALAARLPQASVIDTDQPAEVVTAAARDAVWAAHVARHRAAGRSHPPQVGSA